jgi:RNA polymerase sigma-70 factor
VRTIQDAFVGACTAAGRESAVDDDELAAVVQRAQLVLPGVAVEPLVLAAALGRVVAAGIALAEVDVAELVLALGCVADQREALALLERRYVQPLPEQLAHMRLDAAALADVQQTTRGRLLLAREGQSPRLLGYAGRGQLGALVRVIATRAALDATRGERRKREVGLSELTDVLMTSADPERLAASVRKREVFRAAFEAAIAGLDPADRTMMRLYAIDGVGIDGLALAYGIHRSTAARRVAAVRERIRLGTVAELARRGVAEQEIASIIAVVDEGLELTLSRILADPLEPTDPTGPAGTTGRERDA